MSNNLDPSELPVFAGTDAKPILGRGTRYGLAQYTLAELLPLDAQQVSRWYPTVISATETEISELLATVTVERYATDTPFCPASYRATDLTEYNTYPARLRFTDAGGRFWVIAESIVETAMAGAKCDGVTIDQDAVYACNDFFNLGDVGFDVRVSKGVSLIYGGMTPQKSGTWFGYGDTVSVLKGVLNPATPLLLTHATLWQRPAGQPQLEQITFDGIKFEGDWGGSDHTDPTKMNNGSGGRGQVFSLRDYTRVTVKNCTSDWSRRQAFVTRACEYTFWDNVKVLHCGQSGINTAGALVTILTNCTCMWNGDDGLNAAFDDAVVDGLNASGLVMVLGCRFEQVLKLRYGAANHVIIADSIFKFTRTGAITSTANGESIPNHSLAIDNNIITNVVDLSLIETLAADNAQAIVVSQSKLPSIGTGGDAVAAVPGLPDGSGNIISPYTYLERMGVTYPAPGQMGVSITNNKVGRKAEPVAAFSEYNLGLWWTKDGWIDPPFTLVELQGQTHVGISVGTVGRNVLISNNQLDGVFTGLQFTLRALEGANQNIRVFDNLITNYTRYGMEQENTGAIDIHVDRNTFDGDPDRQHVRHSADGTWTSASVTSGCVGILSTSPGLRVTRNTFRNLNVVHQSDASTFFDDNLLECQPVAIGSASNKGIRVIYRAGPEWRYLIKGSNPSDPVTWNTILNHCPLSADAMPSSGFWVEGAIVVNSAPVVDDGYTVEYWRRITTGSNHVLGTDWAAVYSGEVPDLPLLLPVSGEYVQSTTGAGGGALGSRAGVAANADLFPFTPRRDLTIDQMAVNVTVGVASGTGKFAIYESDANGRPDVRLLNSTTDMDFSTTGIKTTTVALTLLAGKTYWIGLRTNGIAQFSTWPLTATPDINGGSVVTTARKVLRRSLAYAPAAPASWTFTSSEINDAAAPAVWLRMV